MNVVHRISRGESALSLSTIAFALAAVLLNSGCGGQGDVETGPSKLPPPPGSSDVSRPSGTTANLKVLPWAGFKAAVSYTFDDSQPSQIAHYAELQAAGVPMTFYVSSGNSSAARYDETFTQAVHDGHEIGNHTAHHCHADLTGCSFGTAAASLGEELDQCNAYIPKHFGQSAVWTVASPFGDSGYNVPAQSRAFLNRGVGSGMIVPSGTTDPFNLPCHLAGDGEKADSFNAATDTAHANGAWLIFLIHSILPTTDTWYNPVDIADITGSMSHAKSLNEVWLDTVANVGAYWRGQKILSAVTPTSAGTNQTWTWTLPTGFPTGKYLRVTVDGGTLTQNGAALPWVTRGYYEVALDAHSLTWSP